MTKKIFCVGMQKTGTSSLGKALRLLGFTVGNPVRKINTEVDWRQPDPKLEIVSKTIELVREVEVLCDSPCPFVFRELDAAFPQSKFILTTRDTEDWLGSYRRYFPDKNNHLRRWMYGVESLSGHEEHYCALYDSLNTEIAEYFSDRPSDFLTMDITKGAGWLELVSFLGPEFLKPFPHVNKSPV